MSIRKIKDEYIIKKSNLSYGRKKPEPSQRSCSWHNQSWNRLFTWNAR